MKEQNKDFMPKAQVEIMLEGLRSDFKVFGDGLVDIRRGVKDLNKTAGLVLKDIDVLKSDVVDIKRNIKDIKEEIVEINEKLDTKADKTVSDDCAKRIVKLEKKFA